MTRLATPVTFDNLTSVARVLAAESPRMPQAAFSGTKPPDRQKPPEKAHDPCPAETPLPKPTAGRGVLSHNRIARSQPATGLKPNLSPATRRQLRCTTARRSLKALTPRQTVGNGNLETAKPKHTLQNQIDVIITAIAWR